MKVQKSLTGLLILILMMVTVSAESFLSGHCDNNILTSYGVVDYCSSSVVAGGCGSDWACDNLIDGEVDAPPSCTEWVSSGLLPTTPQQVIFNVTNSTQYDRLEIYTGNGLTINGSQDITSYAISLFYGGSWNVFVNETIIDLGARMEECETDDVCLPINVTSVDQDVTPITQIKLDVYDVYSSSPTSVHSFEFMACDLNLSEALTDPVIDDVTDYRYDPISQLFQNKVFYKVGSNITYNLTTTMSGGIDVYVAVDCNFDGQAPFATDWIFSTFTQNCTYNTIGNFTARVYATDLGDWSNYNTNQDINVSIRECEAGSDCSAGEQCLAGTCVPSTNYTFCTDTDGGININVSGTVQTDFVTVSDACGGFASVNELYCTNSSPVGYQATAFSCAVNEYCNAGACANISGLGLLTLTVKDFDTANGLSVINYLIQDLVNGTYYNGTVTDSTLLSITQGNNHSITLTDNSDNYKRYRINRIVFNNTHDAFMQKHCTGDCIFEDDFSYGSSPFKFGWRSPSDYEVVFQTEYGYMLELDNSVSTSSIFNSFPTPNFGIYSVEYDLVMADQIPADGQDLWVYIEDVGGVDIALLRYVVDETAGNRMYFWSNNDWVEVSLANKYITTSIFRTKLSFDTGTGTYDIAYDRSASSGYQTLVSGATMLNNRKIGLIEFDPLPSIYDRITYIDNIVIGQSPLANETDSVTVLSAEDSNVPWYFDNDGTWHFDSTKCGREGAILCLIKGVGIWAVSNFVKWLFTGIHLLYFIVMLLIAILVAPLWLEWRRQNMGGK